MSSVYGTVLGLLAGTAIAVPVLPEPRSVLLILDNCDPAFRGKQRYGDHLTAVTAQGQILFQVSQFNNCETIGTPHKIAVDPKGKRIWVTENVGNRIVQLDFYGTQRLRLPDLAASALAVDPATGNLWVTTTKGRIDSGQTRVFDRSGKPLATYDVTGFDIAYDPVGQAMWLAGRKLVRIDLATTKVTVEQEITKWCASCLAVSPQSGHVWVAVREHPDINNSENALLVFDNQGNSVCHLGLDQGSPFSLAICPRTDAVWVVLLGKAIQRFSQQGKLEFSHALPATACVMDPGGEGVWVATEQAVICFDVQGTQLRRLKLPGKSSQVWLAAILWRRR